MRLLLAFIMAASQATLAAPPAAADDAAPPAAASATADSSAQADSSSPVESSAPAATGGVGLAAREPPVPGEGPPEIPEGLRSPARDAPCYLLVDVTRADLEAPERLAPLLAEARARDLRVVARLLDADWSPVEEWSARLRHFVQQAGTIDAFQLFGPGVAAVPAGTYAFLLKNARVAVRAAGSRGLLVSAPLEESDGAWAGDLFAADAAPYLDALAARGAAALAQVAAIRDRDDPRAALWVTDAAIEADDPAGGVVRDYLESVSAGAAVVLFHAPGPPAPPAAGEAGAAGPWAVAEPGPEPAEEPAPGAILAFVRSLFPPGLRPAAAAALPFDPTSPLETATPEAARPRAVRVLAFFDSETRSGIAAYRAAGSPGGTEAPAAAPPAAVRFTLRAPVERLDLVRPRAAGIRTLSEGAGAGAVVELPLGPAYRLLRYRLAASAIPVRESTEVGARAELTAEEIIARERESRGIQAVRLRHYEAHATISIHYRLAALTDESVDVVTENRLFYRDGKQDLEQTALYVNGSLWRGKSPPYLPYLQPGTVNEVPLDIALDERYRYALEGRAETSGRECYVIAFEPIDPTHSLYRGRVYIDTRLFTRVKMEAVQTGLKDPMRSNEVVYEYGPIPTGRGDAWLPLRMRGQMTFELLGYNLAVERTATYSDYRANVEGFEERRAEAYGSGRPLMRETDSGLFRLDTKGGAETLRSLSTPRNALLVFGISAGETGHLSLPFAGVNLFDFDFHGTGTQLNMALAGPFADIAWTHPDLFGAGAQGRPWSLALQGRFNALRSDDKNATSSGTPGDDRVDILRESILATLARPLGNHVRGAFYTQALYQNFKTVSETAPEFVLPSDGVEATFGLRTDFARLGWLVGGWGEWGTRSRWDPWGLPGQPYSPDDRTFTRLGLEFRKAFYFGIYNKLSLGVTGYDGRGLDRFSRFELGDFRSARVRGFNDSGIHFDKGLVLDQSYSFPLGRSVRVDAGLQTGYIHSAPDFGPGYERVMGAGLSVDFSGPWSTFVTVRMGRSVSSSIAGKGGGGDVRLVFFRTFDKWSRRGGTGRPKPRPAEPVTPDEPPETPGRR